VQAFFDVVPKLALGNARQVDSLDELLVGDSLSQLAHFHIAAVG
jgi:hypothetical protein